MDEVSKYYFYKTKYGDELLIDLVSLKEVKKFLSQSKLHSLTYYDITLITEGSGFFRIGDQTHNVGEGDVLFSAPGQPREWDAQAIIDGYALIFEEEFLLSFFNDLKFLSNISYFNPNTRKSNRLTLSPDEYQQVRVLIQNVQEEIVAYQEKDKHILRAILYQILKYLDRIFVRKNKDCCPNPHNEHLNKFLELVNSQYRNLHAVSDYAGKLCLTPNYLNELVKKERGKTAKQIINRKLLAEAKTLLCYSQASVREIADTLGFENPSYFVRFFHKQSGVTPLAYRNKEKP